MCKIVHSKRTCELSAEGMLPGGCLVETHLEMDSSWHLHYIAAFKPSETMHSVLLGGMNSFPI